MPRLHSALPQIALLFACAILGTSPALGQSNNAIIDGGAWTDAAGNPGSQNLPTAGNFYGNSQPTAQSSYQSITNGLPTTSSMPYPGTYTAPGNLALDVCQFGTQLPVTNMDSFVYQAGGSAYDIYGDEGVFGPPPLMGFNPNSYIEAGITADAAGLTTGHYRGDDQMPSAWGWTMSDGNGPVGIGTFGTGIVTGEGIVGAVNFGPGGVSGSIGGAINTGSGVVGGGLTVGPNGSVGGAIGGATNVGIGSVAGGISF